ncbi:MAG: hypothetical protein V4719_06945 [Planctomycetota bacterium]
MSRWLKLRLLACYVLLVAGGSIVAAEPRRELWQLVSKDVGLAVEARGLSEQARRFLGSELFQRIQRHSSWQLVLQSKEAKEIEELQRTVRDVTKQPLHGWLDKLFGQEALLSVVPQPEGRPHSVLLLRLARPADLTEILAACQQLEPRTETRLEHQGQAYFRRTKVEEPTEEMFYALLDDVLVLSDRAESLTPVLDLARDPEQRRSIHRDPNFQQTMKALHASSVIRVFIQPVAWGATRDAQQVPSTDLVGRLIQRAWSRCQGVGIGIRQESGLITEVVARSDDLANDSVWMKLVAKTSGAPAFLARVPNSAVLAFAGRHDLADVTVWALSQIPPENLKKWKSTRQVISGFLLGSDLLTEILPQLPADFGGFLIPRSDLELDAPPVDGLLAVSLPTATAEDAGNQQARPTVRNSIDNALRTAVSMLAAMHNSTSEDNATIEQVDQNGVTVHWIESLGALRPAYAMSPDYFLVASSPQLIRDFLSQSPSNTLAADERWKKLREFSFADASQIVVLQGRLLASVIRERREFLLKQLEACHKLQPEDAGKRLDRMLEWVQLSDAVVLASSWHADHIKLVLVLAVSPTEPAKP